MPRLLPIKTVRDARGSLSVIEKNLGFEIRRVFYIYKTSQTRGGHGHRQTKMVLVALNGTVEVTGQTPTEDFHFKLEDPSQGLWLDPQDWHEMHFQKDAVLLVLASEEYNPDDYFHQKYRP